ncbi:hypothetical protein [Lacticaseibacillus paracasei]|uniref:hypothetical protein n=1 Tax=Lacticaseibacillus paracasei TaxID=1597 RepID=UPI0040462ED8
MIPPILEKKVSNSPSALIFSYIQSSIQSSQTAPEPPARLGTSTKMPVCLFARQVLWPRESREPEKLGVAIKVGLITLTRITVGYVRNSQSAINLGAETKAYSVTIKSKEHQMAFQATQAFQDTVKLWCRIETKNAETKTKHGYQRSWSNSIETMTLFYANMERIMNLISEK